LLRQDRFLEKAPQIFLSVDEKPHTEVTQEQSFSSATSREEQRKKNMLLFKSMLTKEAAALLIHNETVTSMTDAKGNTLLHILFGELSDYNSNNKVDRRHLRIFLRLLARLLPDINARNSSQETSLLLAVGQDFDTAQVLLDEGADPRLGDARGWTPLHWVCSEHKENAALCALLIEKGADVDAKSHMGTPLHGACYHGHVKISIMLIEKGADVHAEGEEHATPLHEASSLRNLPLCELLIKHGACSVRVAGMGTALSTMVRSVLRFDSGRSRISSCDKDQLKRVLHALLAHAKTDMVRSRPQGTFAPDMNQRYDETQIIKIIVAAAGDVEQLTSLLRAPFHKEVKDGDCNICDILVKGKRYVHDAWPEDTENNTPLHVLALAFDDERHVGEMYPLEIQEIWRPLIQYLKEEIHVQNSEGKTAVHSIADRAGVSATQNWCPLGDILVEEKANLEIQDNKGFTPLMYTVFHRRIATFKKLIERVAQVTSKDTNGNTSLHIICDGRRCAHSKDDISYVQEQICRMLLEKGVLINEQNHVGDTALHGAARNSDTRLSKLLIDKGANKNVINKKRQTPLHLCCYPRYFLGESIENEKQDIAVALLSELPEDDLPRVQPSQDIFGNLPSHMWCGFRDSAPWIFRALRVDVQEANASGWTPLHIACASDNQGIVGALLNLHVDINRALPASGKTPLMIACENGSKAVCDLLLTQNSLKKGARDATLGTALDWACEFGHVEICKKLIAHGFYTTDEKNINKVRLLESACQHGPKLITVILKLWNWVEVDSRGNTPLHIASDKGLWEVVDILLKQSGVASKGTIQNSRGKTAADIAREKGYMKIAALLNEYGLS
jgi:ankyrin repeat protein